MLLTMASSRRCLVLLLLAIPFLFLAFTTSVYYYVDSLPPAFRSTADHALSGANTWINNHQQWTWDVKRDANNYGLSDSQCAAAFPDYYLEVDGAVESRQKAGNITKEEIDISWCRERVLKAMIHNRQLYIIEAKWSENGTEVPDALALLSAINRAITAYPGEVPDIEFSVGFGDDLKLPGWKHVLWAASRQAHEANKWVVPSPGFWAHPIQAVGAYRQVRDEILLLENDVFFGQWEEKVPKALWRGVAGADVEGKNLFAATEGQSWADVQETSWENTTAIVPEGEDLELTMPEHCAFKYIIHTEGSSPSPRNKYLLNCHSTPMTYQVTHIEPHTHLFNPSGPEQNTVLVERDFSNLEFAVRTLEANPPRAAQIADNAVRIFRDRYLTPAAQACYWRRLIKGWASVQGFETELWEEVVVGGGPSSGAKEEMRDEGAGKRRVKRLRGKPFETFILEGWSS